MSVATVTKAFLCVFLICILKAESQSDIQTDISFFLPYLHEIVQVLTNETNVSLLHQYGCCLTKLQYTGSFIAYHSVLSKVQKQHLGSQHETVC